MLRACVKTQSKDKVYNPNRYFIHYGYIAGDIFYYNGNWVAEDNGLYWYDPEEEPEDQEIHLSECEVIRTW